VEMLLEPYVIQVDSTWNKLQTLTEYVEDTEDFINIELDSQRNQLIRLDLVLTLLGVSMALVTAATSLFAMNVELAPGMPEGPYSMFLVISLSCAGGALLLVATVVTLAKRRKLL
jgi:magnesium transporter